MDRKMLGALGFLMMLLAAGCKGGDAPDCTLIGEDKCQTMEAVGQPQVEEAPAEVAEAGECTQLSLTPEECANLGTHTYSWSGTTTGTCYYGEAPSLENSGQGSTTIEIWWQEGKPSFAFEGTAGHAFSGDFAHSSRSGSNVYSSPNFGANSGQSTLTFTSTGFSATGNDPRASIPCTWAEEYRLVDSAPQDETIVVPDEINRGYADAYIAYVIADIQLGGEGVRGAYQGRSASTPINSTEYYDEGVRRWDMGVRVCNIGSLERKYLGGMWQIVHAGTDEPIESGDVITTMEEPDCASEESAPAQDQPQLQQPGPPGQGAQIQAWLENSNSGTVTINGVLTGGEGPMQWIWGDGTVSESWFPATHTYSQASTYNIRVCDIACSAIANVTVTVQPAASSTYDELRVRYILADIQLGGVLGYYRGFPNDPAAAEAVRRWEAGVRVRNIDYFERRNLPDRGWTIVYAPGHGVASDFMVEEEDIQLTTDP